jgi:hypothetical protein
LFLVLCDCDFAQELSDWRVRDGNDPSVDIAKDAAGFIDALSAVRSWCPSPVYK